MWLLTVFLTVWVGTAGHFCGVTPEWEAEQLQDFQQTRRLAVVPALSRSSTQGPFRIHVHFLDMTALPASNITFIQQQVIPSAIKWYYNVLRVYNLAENWKLSQTTCSSAVNVPTEHQNPGLPSTDYVLYVFAVNEPAKNYIAKGGFCALDGNSLTNPIAGTLGYNAAFYKSMTPEQEIMTARHEIAHALAFSPSLWPYFRQPDGSLYSSYTTTVTERGHTVTLLTFPKALERARTAFGCSTMQGIELENQGAVGTSGSHWEKRLMANDFMVGTIIIDMLYSDVTLALFEDSGWYTVNYDYTTPTTWGHGKGCDFVNLNCVSGGVTQFSEWCTAADNNNDCSSTNTIKASCNYATYGTALTSFYQYFASPNDGGQDSYTDYCPYAVPFSDGDCKGRGYAATWFSATSYGEKICDTCMCFTGSTVRAGRVTTGAVRALCYDVACSDTVATITLGSTSIACPAAGGQLTNIPNFTGYLNCPPFSELCGTRPCINGCWGAGKCINGVCQCDDGYSGVDCSTICDSSCRKCTGTGNTQCSACYSAGVLNAASGTCAYCDVTCLTCTGSASNQCSTCVSDAHTALGVCLCDNGFTRSPDQSLCIACHSSCAKCQGTLSTQCTACHTNAALPVGQSIAACGCNYGFYMKLDWTCAQCPVTCKECLSDAGCSSCYPATATISQSGVCICPTGFYLSTDVLSCSQCDISCLACSASGPQACTSCKPASATISLGACVCPTTFYLSADGSTCSICDPSCATCLGSGTGGCLTCKPGGVFTLSGGAAGTCSYCDVTCLTCTGSASNQCSTCVSNAHNVLGVCQCDNGFTRSPDQSLCIACHPSCAQCQGTLSTQCTVCHANAALPVGQSIAACGCNYGFYMKLDWTCAQCPVTCKECLSDAGCSSCYPATATISLSGVCICPTGFYLSTDVLSCSQCDISCLACSASGPQACTTCKPASATISLGTCVCPTTFYLSADGSTCSICDPSCATCLGSGIGGCLTCYSGGVLTPSLGPGRCGCVSGQFYSAPLGCQFCSSGCKTCTGQLASQCMDSITIFTWEAHLKSINSNLPLTTPQNSLICYYFDLFPTCVGEIITKYLSKTTVIDVQTWTPTEAECSDLLNQQRAYLTKIANSLFSSAITSASIAGVTQFPLLTQSWILRVTYHSLATNHVDFVAAVNSISNWSTVHCDGPSLLYDTKSMPKPAFMGSVDCEIIGSGYVAALDCSASACSFDDGLICCQKSITSACCISQTSAISTVCSTAACQSKHHCCAILPTSVCCLQ